MKYFILKKFLLFYFIHFAKSLLSEEEITEPSRQFRGTFVSAIAGDFELIKYDTEVNFKARMTYILDTLKMYNMNALIFHVRTENNAFYQSKLNPPWYYFSKINFYKFDPLKWLIEESHRRGIDFHAWFALYRISFNNKLSLEAILNQYIDYKNNPAYDKNCILNGSHIILNPGLEKVRNFITQTVIEFLEEYDVDAIQFDDYFYTDMGAYGALEGDFTILDEQDQITYEEYIKNNPGCNYHTNNATEKANWRREQVNLLIKQVHEEITKYNKKYNKKVQFGVSPSGVYKNGNGIVTYNKNKNAVTTGSLTMNYEHYSAHLFSDTLKWINNEWIDYILPHAYLAFDVSYQDFGKTMDWWDKVVKYKNVNLFSGIGLYHVDDGGWYDNEDELYNQLTYVAKLSNTEGAAIKSFNDVRKLRDGIDSKASTQMKNGMKAWKKKVPLPEIKSFQRIILEKPNNLKFENRTISFDKINGAKYYIVYRSKENIMFNSDEIIDIFGSNEENVTWVETEEGNFNYGIKALSYTNTLGEGGLCNQNDENNSGKYLSFRISLLSLYCLLILLF